MEVLFKAIQCIFLVFLVPFVFYYLVLSFVGIFIKIDKVGNYPPKCKFALIIPSHNEEVMIGKVLDNVKAIQYPKNLFDLIVVADNCYDKTAEIARKKGAIVYERFDKERVGKGHVLDWIITKLLDEKADHDAFVIIDADSFVSQNFLQVMNKKICQGHSIIQGFYSILNPTQSWLTCLMYASFSITHYLRPLAKNKLGFSASLSGNGMCFSREIFQRYGWKCFSTIEDAEYYIKLLFDNVKVEFAPEAVVYAQMPTSLAGARSQRIRWESNYLNFIKQYFFPLLSSSIRRRSLVMFEGAMDLLPPAFTISMGLPVLFLIFNLISTPYSQLLTWTWIGVIAGQLIHLSSGLILVRAPKKVYFSFLYTPLYVIWKIWIYLLLVLKFEKNQWIRTSRKDIQNARR